MEVLVHLVRVAFFAISTAGEENASIAGPCLELKIVHAPLLAPSPVSFTNSSEVTGCCAAGRHEQKRLASREKSRFGRLRHAWGEFLVFGQGWVIADRVLDGLSHYEHCSLGASTPCPALALTTYRLPF